MAEFNIALPEGCRFDDRQLHSEDDGRDFESFVYEALGLLTDANNLRPGFGRGRDGAIDHMIEGNGQRTVVECKFIGRHATSAPGDRWSEVRRNLQANLERLAAKAPQDRQGSPYAPWLDNERSITIYMFCVSYAFSHAQERDALQAQIADDFLKLSATVPQLSHLAAIQVQVRGWDEFYGELRRHFPLRYRWFGELPRGIVPLREKRYEIRSFRQFLFEESLPFFSREQFIAESTDHQAQREEQIVSSLAADLGDEALLLSGAGGVGKTRLALELCDRLSKRGWLAFRLTDNATSSSIRDLIRAHAEPAQVVLLSDYAERADDLSAITEEISLINDRNSHRIRLIATCRMSAFSGVHDALAPLAPREIFLGTPRVSDPNELAFTQWAVRQILAFGRIPNADQVAQVCHGLPILAAFALFLHERNAAQFAEQFGDLSGIRDFRDWAKRRLDISLRGQYPAHSERETIRQLALLSLRLPMTKVEADEVADQSPLDASLLEMMRADCWVEAAGDQVLATHDVFADAMVAHYVFETRAVANERLAELLRIATEKTFLNRALLAMDRLVGHPDFDTIDSISIVRALIARVPNAVIAVHERLVRGRLLSDRGKVELLAEHPGLHAAVARNRDCDADLSHIADTLARLRRTDPIANDTFVTWAATVIAPLLAAGLATPHPSNMKLRRAFALLPSTYLSEVLSRITSEPSSSQTHYLLVAWLNSGLPTDDIVAATAVWLSANAARNLKTSFVIRAWIDAGGERALIDRHVLAWVEAFGSTKTAQFVYSSWLDAGGQRDLIDRHVLAWIDVFGATEGARFVYRSWLNAGGQRDLIDCHVLAWIDAFTTKNARFVFSAWLDAGGQRDLLDRRILAWIDAFGATEDAKFIYPAWIEAGGQRDLIDRHVLAWIEAFGAIEDAKFVYPAWIEAGGQRDLIDRHVLAWIDAFGTTEDASFVYRKWLSAGGNPDLIERYVLAWIDAFGATEDAQFMYRAWLDAGGKPDIIERYLLAWIDTFGATECAQFVYRGWLAAGHDFETISEQCLAWFQAHATSYESSFLLRYLVRRDDLPSAILHSAIKWCALFAKREEVVWQAASLLTRHSRSVEGIALVRAFLACVRFLNPHRLALVSTKAGEDGPKLSSLILRGFGDSLGILELDQVDREELRNAHARLLTTSHIYEAACVSGKNFTHPALIHHVAEMIECGIINMDAHRVALVRFADWMRAWPEEVRDDLELAISRLRAAAPSDLWDRIPRPKP